MILNSSTVCWIIFYVIICFGPYLGRQWCKELDHSIYLMQFTRIDLKRKKWDHLKHKSWVICWLWLLRQSSHNLRQKFKSIFPASNSLFCRMQLHIGRGYRGAVRLHGFIGTRSIFWGSTAIDNSQAKLQSPAWLELSASRRWSRRNLPLPNQRFSTSSF